MQNFGIMHQQCVISKTATVKRVLLCKILDEFAREIVGSMRNTPYKMAQASSASVAHSYHHTAQER